MKKILIATACAFTLCLASCASKKAPETENKTVAPQIDSENQESSEENSSDTLSEDSENDEEKAAEEESEENLETDNQDPPLTSEAFPEPEAIEEEEIITLEPVEEEETPANEAVSEEVEREEPPEITIINQEEIPGAQENEPSDSENSDNDISANDVIIVDNSSDSDGISGGIDITDDDSDSGEEYREIEKDITPSRSVTLKKFEYLDVTYPGTGWIYMGLTDNSKDLAYFGRKLGTKDTKFTLQARDAGRKIIHFYRNDPLTGQYLDDYIEVIITSENGSNKTHIEAPEYKLPVQKKEKQTKKVEETVTESAEDKTEKKDAKAEETTAKTSAANTTSSTNTNKSTSSSSTDTAKAGAAVSSSKTSESKTAAEEIKAEEDTKQTSQSAQKQQLTSSQTSDPALLLKEAQLLYNEKEYKTALSKLNQFFEYSTDNRDEALYLKGQILEAKSDVRDIKGAIDAYTTLTKNYPASKLWDSANKRIIYLKRFYLEVR